MVNILSTLGLSHIRGGGWEGKPLKELPADVLLQDLEACSLLVGFCRRTIFQMKITVPNCEPICAYSSRMIKIEKLCI
jgi:hypothetical protein